MKLSLVEKDRGVDKKMDMLQIKISTIEHEQALMRTLVEDMCSVLAGLCQRFDRLQQYDSLILDIQTGKLWSKRENPS